MNKTAAGFTLSATHYAQAFANELETIVRKYPEQWFNYYAFWKDGL